MERPISKKKKIIIITLSILLIIAIAGGTIFFTGAWKPMYREIKTQSFRIANRNIQTGEVVFTGDSITELCDLGQFYPNITAYNRGISADTTEGLLKRMDESIFDLAPKVIVLLIGINDLAFFGKSEDEVLVNYRKILSQIADRLPTAAVIIQSVYPVNSQMYKDEVFFHPEKIVRLNTGLSALAEEFSYTYANI
ncbi:MAG: GDSL-type esterase/lipase family protein, partial [Clostridia bacterium]